MRSAFALFLAVSIWTPAAGQVKALSQGPNRMEIMLERKDGGQWKQVDPGLVFASNDLVRFKFRTNFDGYLYVMNQSTSGKYEQLFPREETGTDNRIQAGKEYMVPATQTAFRIAGPAGHEVVYWMVTPVALHGEEVSAPKYVPLPPPPVRKDGKLPNTLTPRCDDALLQARGDCIDTSAGPKLTARGGEVPSNLAQAAQNSSRDLLVMRQKNSAVISSPEPLRGPVVYEFHLAHR